MKTNIIQNNSKNNDNKLVISKTIKQLLINEFTNRDNKNKTGIGRIGNNK